ncbi:hypothetical protein ACLIBH_05280 [Virgibacillus sp. W0430]|uniref:hypothetical protein n=1 Tax=Virgibacillus sp. W0430 TaxID=3391580 RepID=UPI003F45473D
MKKYSMKLLIIAILGIILIGCGKFTIDGEDGEKTTIDVGDLKDGKVNVEVEGADGEEGGMNIESDEEGNMTMKIKTDEGEFESKSGEGTEIPEGFPTDFPIPDSAALQMATTTTENEITSYSVAFTFTEDPESVYNKVKEYAEDKALEISMESISEMDEDKTYMLGAGESSSDSPEYFQFNIFASDENTGSVIYGLPTNK